MRILLAVVFVFYCTRSVFAEPLTVKEISLMLRSGYKSETILRDLSARHFAGTLDPAAEQQLRDANASPALIDALKSGNNDAVSEEARDQAGSFYNIGRTYFAQKNYRESIAPLQRAVEINPQFAAAWIFLGTAYQQLAEPENAAQALYHYVALEPTDKFGWFYLGLSESDQKHFGNGAQAFEHYTKLAPEDVDGWDHLGLCYGRLGRTNDAVVTLRHAISMKPNNAHLWQNLAVAYRDSGQTEEASEAYNRYQALSSR
jgi:tetratricopeptide (TPR) repeat protein